MTRSLERWRICGWIALTCSVLGCAQDTDTSRDEEGFDNVKMRAGAILIEEDAGADTSVDATDATDGSPRVDDGEAEAIAQARARGVTLRPTLTFEGLPGDAAFLEAQPPVITETCSTTAEAEPAPSDDAQRRGRSVHGRAPYRPDFSRRQERAIPPRGVFGGGPPDTFPAPDPALVQLQASYRAVGCADDARADEPACRDHPYRVAIDADEAP